MIIVRKTRLKKADDLHKYNIYIPKGLGYVNVYTCMCCTKTITHNQAFIDEKDTGLTLSDIPPKTIEHWCKELPKDLADSIKGEYYDQI